MTAQASKALERANKIRSFGAEYREQIAALPRSEALTLAAVTLLNPPEAIQRMRLSHFLRAIPYIGRTKVKAILLEVGIHDPFLVIGPERRQSARVLSDRQRHELASDLLWQADRIDHQGVDRRAA